MSDDATVGRPHEIPDLDLDTNQWVQKVRAEIQLHRERGNLARYAGTGSAMAAAVGSAAVPVALFLPFLGIGAAGVAIILQKQRDDRLRAWEDRLDSLLTIEETDLKMSGLHALFGEISAKNS